MGRNTHEKSGKWKCSIITKQAIIQHVMKHSEKSSREEKKGQGCREVTGRKIRRLGVAWKLL